MSYVGIVKLRQNSTIFRRARPTPRPQINKLAVVLVGETVNKFPKLTTRPRLYTTCPNCWPLTKHWRD